MASLWTGLNPARSGVTRFDHRLSNKAKLPAEIMRGAAPTMNSGSLWEIRSLKVDLADMRLIDLFSKLLAEGPFLYSVRSVPSPVLEPTFGEMARDYSGSACHDAMPTPKTRARQVNTSLPSLGLNIRKYAYISQNYI